MKKIHCQNCKKDIGEFDEVRGRVVIISEDGLLAIRKRYDDEYGFQCSCGADSRLAEQERGLIDHRKPKQATIDEVKERVKKNPTKVKETKTYREVDGFRTEAK